MNINLILITLVGLEGGSSPTLGMTGKVLYIREGRGATKKFVTVRRALLPLKIK
jgi:hypothetical protein